MWAGALEGGAGTGWRRRARPVVVAVVVAFPVVHPERPRRHRRRVDGEDVGAVRRGVDVHEVAGLEVAELRRVAVAPDLGAGGDGDRHVLVRDLPDGLGDGEAVARDGLDLAAVGGDGDELVAGLV